MGRTEFASLIKPFMVFVKQHANFTSDLMKYYVTLGINAHPQIALSGFTKMELLLLYVDDMFAAGSPVQLVPRMLNSANSSPSGALAKCASISGLA